MQRSYLLASMLCIAAIITTSLAVAAPPTNMPATMNRIINESAPKSSSVGVLVQSTGDGAVWYARNEQKPYLPASTTKIVTAVMALEHLGPDYRYTTQLLADSVIADGVLHGDLYFRGEGDPSLDGNALRAMARSLAKGDAARGIAPVREVRGRLIADDSFFPRRGPLIGTGWGAGNLPRYYAAPSNALSFQGNSITVVVQGSTAGKAARVSTTPATSLLQIKNSAVTRAGARANVSITRQGNTISVSGSLAPGARASERISVADPARYTAEQMLHALRAAGIKVSSGIEVRIADTRRAAVVAEHRSDKLSALLVPMLKRSDNHMAEQFRWTVLAQAKTDIALHARYPALIEDFAMSYGFSAKGITLFDGSGLSRADRITPQALADILVAAHASPYAQTFANALPVAGVDGTLSRRMVNSAATGNAYAKTGTIRGVSGLAGYVDRGSQERVAFVVLVNGSADTGEARRLQDRIVNYLASAPSAPTRTTAQLPQVNTKSAPPAPKETPKAQAPAASPPPRVRAVPAQSLLEGIIIQEVRDPQMHRKTASPWNTSVVRPLIPALPAGAG